MFPDFIIKRLPKGLTSRKGYRPNNRRNLHDWERPAEGIMTGSGYPVQWTSPTQTVSGGGGCCCRVARPVTQPLSWRHRPCLQRGTGAGGATDRRRSAPLSPPPPPPPPLPAARRPPPSACSESQETGRRVLGEAAQSFPYSVRRLPPPPPPAERPARQPESGSQTASGAVPAM